MARWTAAHERHSRRIAAVVGPLYVAGRGGLSLGIARPPPTPGPWWRSARNAVAVLVTATLAAPLHGRLSSARGRAVLLTRLRRVDLARTAAAAVAVVAALLA